MVYGRKGRVAISLAGKPMEEALLIHENVVPVTVAANPGRINYRAGTYRNIIGLGHAPG